MLIRSRVSYSTFPNTFSQSDVESASPSHQLLAIQMEILRDGSVRERFKWWYYRSGARREMAAVTIMHPWHLSAQQQFVHMCVYVWIWELMLKPDLHCPSHFHSAILLLFRVHGAIVAQPGSSLSSLELFWTRVENKAQRVYIFTQQLQGRGESRVVICHSIISVFNTHAICTNSKLTSFWLMKLRQNANEGIMCTSFNKIATF